MYTQEYEDKINALPPLDKLSIYFDYMIKMVALKHNFVWFDNKMESLWKTTHYYSYEEFISPDRIIVHDNGENWEKFGFAQRFTKVYTGIYDWIRLLE